MSVWQGYWRIWGSKTNGVRRRLSHWSRRLWKLASFAGKTATERCFADLPAWIFVGFGLRVPLRVLGTASYGNCSGTSGPWVWYERHYYRAQRFVYGIRQAGKCTGSTQSGRYARSDTDRSHRRTLYWCFHHYGNRLYRSDYDIVSGKTRRIGSSGLHLGKSCRTAL